MERLDEYRRKRDAAWTPEPAGTEPARSDAGSPRFVVQRHSARRLHYDLRLERDGVLASWAVPKGLPTKAGSRRLVVHTEDHPLEYLDFEGEIPAGTYGAGTMDVYDTGEYDLLDEKRNGQLTVRLRGARLRGTWTLVPARLDGEERNWLLVKRDEGARPTSARRYRPMRATPADALPSRGRWSFEAAWGGERVLARLAEGEAALWSDTGGDVTDRHAAVARALGRGLRTFDCVVDGEIVERDGAAVYVVFDLLELEGDALLERPLEERRALLEWLVDPRTAPLRLSEAFPDGAALLEAAREQGLAGVVAKRRESRYRAGEQSRDWIEVRARPEPPPDEDPPRLELRIGRRLVVVHHPEQRWWPEEGITKADTIAYYRAVAPVLLPHLRDRPFTLRRHYNGPRSPFEWIKDAPPEAPSWVRVAEQPARSRGGALVRYLLVQDEATLVWMVDFGCVDLHVWPSRADRPDRPDYVLFDLDPARVPFADVVRAAHLLHAALGALGLDSLVRTTGGDGLHVLVPVARVHDHAEARAFAEVVAGALVRTSGGLVTTEAARSRRRGVFVDTKMNGHGQQVVAAYSVRPLPGAPVAAPLAWDELTEDLDPRELTTAAVQDRVARLGDLHEALLRGRQRLAAALARLDV